MTRELCLFKLDRKGLVENPRTKIQSKFFQTYLYACHIGQMRHHWLISKWNAKECVIVFNRGGTHLVKKTKPFQKVIKKNNILVSKTTLVRNNMPPLKRAFQIFDLCNDKNWKTKRGTTNFLFSHRMQKKATISPPGLFKCKRLQLSCNLITVREIPNIIKKISRTLFISYRPKSIEF